MDVLIGLTGSQPEIEKLLRQFSQTYDTEPRGVGTNVKFLGPNGEIQRSTSLQDAAKPKETPIVRLGPETGDVVIDGGGIRRTILLGRRHR